MVRKRCPSCGETLPVTSFYRNAGRYDGLSGYCFLCQRVANVRDNARARQRTIDLLGGRCARCGFADVRALHVDHVEGGGARARRASHQRLWNSVRQRPSDFQLLCANCNCIKRIEQREYRPADTYQRVVPLGVLP